MMHLTDDGTYRWQVGVKLATGGVTFLRVRSEARPDAEEEAIRRAEQLGHRPVGVVSATAIREGAHPLLAPFFDIAKAESR